MLNHPLGVSVLCSKRAPGLDALLRHPLRGRLFDVDRVVTSGGFTTAEVDVIPHPMIKGLARGDYDAQTAALVHGSDVVLLLGYLYVLTEPMLHAFPDRILNIHDADLLLLGPDGGPRYRGLQSTRDAIFAGERETRSSVHIATSDLDGGPVIARSAALPVASFVHDAVAAGEDDIVRAYAYAQREWMMRSSWGNLAVEALEWIAAREPAQ
jgi:folate-dependent phosphoribosylglycinamide formyltransferase PurN